MSKNAKNLRKLRKAQDFSKSHRGDAKGPASTNKVNKKRKTWYNPSSPTYWAGRRKTETSSTSAAA